MDGETVKDFIFLGSKIIADGNYNHEIERHLLLGIKAMTNLDSVLKNRDITLPTKVQIVKAVVFPVAMYRCESWTIKRLGAEELMPSNYSAGEDSWSPLDCKEIKLVNTKYNQPWPFTGKTDAEAEVLVLWPPDAKSQLIRKDPDAGKDWRQDEKGTTEDKMIGCHYRLNG